MENKNSWLFFKFIGQFCMSFPPLIPMLWILTNLATTFSHLIGNPGWLRGWSKPPSIESNQWRSQLIDVEKTIVLNHFPRKWLPPETEDPLRFLNTRQLQFRGFLYSGPWSACPRFITTVISCSDDESALIKFVLNWYSSRRKRLTVIRYKTSVNIAGSMTLEFNFFTFFPPCE